MVHKIQHLSLPPCWATVLFFFLRFRCFHCFSHNTPVQDRADQRFFHPDRHILGYIFQLEGLMWELHVFQHVFQPSPSNSTAGRVFRWFHFDFGVLQFFSRFRLFFLRPIILVLFWVNIQTRARGKIIKLEQTSGELCWTMIEKPETHKTEWH